MEYKHQKFLEKLGNNIKYYREQQNLSIKNLSQKTNIRVEYLKKIETGKAHRFNYLQFCTIAEALDIPLHILSKGT